MRLIDRLQALYPEASRRSLRQWLATSRVQVNGVAVSRGDVEVDDTDRIALTAPAADCPLTLIHEDGDVLLVDKPSGLLTIATEQERQRTAYRLLRDWSASRGPRSSRLFLKNRSGVQSPLRLSRSSADRDRTDCRSGETRNRSDRFDP